jgi:DNA-binding HxlR family transcriptional regulator
MSTFKLSTLTENDVKAGMNAAIALFHKRWTMRILWELREGAVNFRSLQTACAELSSSVLNVRLLELRDAGLVEHTVGEGYALTPWGIELLAALRPLAVWAARWHAAKAARGPAR